MWPDRRILDLFGIEIPIIQAPMAGSTLAEMAIAVSNAGGLGSLPCALLSAEQMRGELEKTRRDTSRPMNVNFFCHREPKPDEIRETSWKRRLDAYYRELGVDLKSIAAGPKRAPFDGVACELVEEFRPKVVSFHFGLPDRELLARVKATGAKVISSATSVEEALWLEGQGCDAIIAQGYEAGGHSGMFLMEDISRLVGTMALVPQVVDAVKVPVIAAAMMLGASAVQIGTAYLMCPQAKISPVYRAALKTAKDNETTFTNVITGRPARGIVNRIIREVGPMSDATPEFPNAAPAIAPLRSKAEAAGSGDFSPLWAGQAARLTCELPAAELTKRLAEEALARLRSLGSR